MSIAERFTRLSVTLAFVAGVALRASASEIPVDASHPQCNDVAGPVFCRLAPAIAAAAPADVLVIAAGTYELWGETLTIAKSLTLRGAGIGRTVLDGGGAHSGPVLEITPEADEVRIEGLSITHRVRQGSRFQRAAGIDHQGLGLVVERVEIRDTQGGWGGALSSGAPFAEVEIRHSRFSGNAGFTGAAVDFRDAPGGRLTVRDSSFTGNSAIFTGGGLFARDAGEVVLVNVRIEDNRCGNRGGGIFIATGSESSALSLVDSVVQRNWSKGTGGIAAAGNALSITLKSVTLSDNRSENEPQHSDCSSEHPDVFRSLGGNRVGNELGCPFTVQ